MSICFGLAFFCVFNYHLLCWSASVVLQLILRICILLQSCMPNNAVLFPFTTKKLHQNSMPLFIIMILHLFICGIHELLYACNTTFLCMDLFTSAFFVTGKNNLNTLIGIKLPSLVISNLYSNIIVWLPLVFSFTIITDFLCNGG